MTASLDPVPGKSGGCCSPSRGGEASAPGCETLGATATGTPPDDMIALPGGTFLMGTDDAEGFPHDGEGPVRPVVLSPFSIDRCSVTNESFARFIRATGYRTEAERFGWSFVFWMQIPEDRFDLLVEDTAAAAPWWCKVNGARWDAPEGPGSNVVGRGDHPVVHVSWNDAQSFCHWAGKRLPTEAQWEYAARGGLEQKLYPWGDKLRPEGKHRCNIWQGVFPQDDTAEDGYAGTSPVEAFEPNGFGLSSITGNAWEWCADWFDPTFHRTAGSTDPQGPPEGATRVIKGGSFLCHKSYCNRYRVAARSSNTPDSSTSNMGFRCVRL